MMRVVLMVIGAHEDAFVQERIDVPEKSFSKIRGQNVSRGHEQFFPNGNGIPGTRRHEGYNIACDSIFVGFHLIGKASQKVG